MAEEYLDLVSRFPCPLSYARGHIFKLCHHILQIKTNFPIRDIIAKGQSFEEFRSAVNQIKSVYLPFYLNEKTWVSSNVPELEVFKLKHPPWICQPYVRPPPEEHLRKLEEIKERQKVNEERKRSPSCDQNGMSKRKLKKLERNPHKKFSNAREHSILCQNCPNPCGTKCDRKLCKKCCRTKCYKEELDCVGHKIWVKSKRQKARSFSEELKTHDKI